MMLYTTTLLKMKTAMNARFFRNTFPNSSPSNKVENKDMAFNQLWTGIKMGGIESYRLSFLIAVFILLITSCIFIIKFFLTNNPNNRGSAKDALIRNAMIAFGISAFAGLSCLIIQVLAKV